MGSKHPTLNPDLLKAWRKVDADSNAEQSRREYELRKAWKQHVVARLTAGESLDQILKDGVPLYMFPRKRGRRASPKQPRDAGRPQKYPDSLLTALDVLVPAIQSAVPGVTRRDVIHELLAALAEDIGGDPTELGDIRGLENALRYRSRGN